MELDEVIAPLKGLRLHKVPNVDLFAIVDTSLDEPSGLAAGALAFADRFWAQIDRSGYCWEWRGSVGRGGYGWTLGGQVHRVAYALAVGDPAGGVIAHICDNKICCRPSHLILRTNSENIKEMHQKGRANHTSRRLTNQQVLEIRARHLDGVSINKLAERFGLTYMNVWSIVRRKTWRHLP